ncbi:RNA demethylase ALKBH9B-like [Dioscorea cayenensis subsp. rotundata]|uniref:RNA demethylase ALKBH9B-like n=1 Tax=Dioscorea cayennensis subsp. rotundata TaxID=55577 RepID=A0AB40CFJ4_DIOCR|nr:RNA demethylase ALKBH9B-like [Dioscorea cayenensis subsp. rotundata]
METRFCVRKRKIERSGRASEMADPLLQGFDPSELEIAGEFLSNWLPFLTRDLCPSCSSVLRDRIHSLRPVSAAEGATNATWPVQGPDLVPDSDHIEPTGWDPEPPAESSKARVSWADMAQEDELGDAEEAEVKAKSAEEDEKKKKPGLSREQRELIRFRNVGRNTEFICLERVKGKIVNIAEGLELHTGIFSAAEQKRIVDFIYELQKKGRNSELGERTYTEPQKWMRGKGRVTIQFGCCYNYAMDREGNPPGILKHVVPDSVPPLFKVIIKRLVSWHVLPTSCVPDSCIVNIYEPGDCIPPHIDSHDFVRPFCTVSFLSECNILFGSGLKVEGPGEFSGSFAIPLPVGSVLVLNGNGADIAKHCVPAVPTKRISITFRKMDGSKWPLAFTPEPDLQNIQPLVDDMFKKGPPNQDEKSRFFSGTKTKRNWKKSVNTFVGVEPGADHPESGTLLHDQDRHSKRSPSPNQITVGKSSIDSHGLQRGSESSGKSFEQKRRPNFRGIQHLLDQAGNQMKRSPRTSSQVWTEEENNSLYGSARSHVGRVRMEQKNNVTSHSRHGEDGPATVMAEASEPFHPSGLRIEALDNGRRKVRVSLSDEGNRAATHAAEDHS